MHDTPDELATPGGVVLDWRAGECEPVPGVTMPRLVLVERDYPATAERMAALGPLIERLGATTKGVRFDLTSEVEYLGKRNGLVRKGSAAGRPSLALDTHLCEAILALSGTTNGEVAAKGFADLEKRTGRPLSDLNGHRRITFADTQQGPMA